MKPVKFDACNITFAENQPEYIPLPAFIQPDGTIVTEWELSSAERRAIVNGKNIRLSVMTFNKPLQPVLLYVEGVTESGLPKYEEAPPPPAPGFQKVQPPQNVTTGINIPGWVVVVIFLGIAVFAVLALLGICKPE